MRRTAPAPDNAITFEADGVEYTMVFDMKAIALFERETDVSIVEAMEMLSEAESGGRMPKLSHLAFLIQAGLSKHHPEMTADDAMQMLNDETVLEALGGGLAEAMPSGDGSDGADESAVGNASKPAEAKPAGKKGGAGTKSSVKPSKRKSRRKSSGG